VFCSKENSSGLSGLLQCPLGYEGRFYSVEIGLERSLSPVLLMRLLPLYWLLDGQRLCDLMPFRVLTYTGLSWNIKVSNIIKRDT